jgi:UDP:flavonoid glycosyltransferase YjiC (YdhE family)
MHYLCSPFGSAGDVHPVMGVALELQKRGHRITFVVNDYFRELVERHGFGFEPMGTAEEFLASANSPDLWNPFRSFRHLYESLIGPAVRTQYEAFARLYEPGGTVGIANCFGFGALVAQDKVGIPVVTLHCQPAVIWSDIEPPVIRGNFGPRWMQSFQYNLAERLVIDRVVCPSLNALRSELGLGPVQRITRWWHSRFAVACLFPEWFCPPQPDWPAHCVQTDFPLWDEQADAELSPEVEAYLAAGPPPLVFTPGSSNRHGKAFFRAAADACRRLGRRGMLLTRFPEQIPSILPPGVVHFLYVPFGRLLGRSAATIHHGGIGSTAQGLAAGTPQLIMALAHDQFDNAARIKRLGVGDWLTARAFTGPRVARMLDRMLSSPSTAAACRAIAARLAPRDGIARTAAAIEHWSSRQARRA